MKNKWISFCLIAWILAFLPLTVTAQEFDPDQRGSISVSLVSSDEEMPMTGAELSVYYIATVDLNTQGELHYICSDPFAEAGLSPEDPELVAKLDAFVAESAVPVRKMLTDHQGKAVCEDLPLGLYFVKQTGETEDFAPCASFLVTLPMKTEEGFRYDVDATPKTDVAKYIDITIQKVWNTGAAVKIPDSVTVQLLLGDTVVQTATLNEENTWQITYSDLPESDAYRIKEVNVPKGFTATYAQKEYTFTVTNTPSLAQTGQLIWPIPVFAMAGIALLVTGFAVLRKSGKANA